MFAAYYFPFLDKHCRFKQNNVIVFMKSLLHNSTRLNHSKLSEPSHSKHVQDMTLGVSMNLVLNLTFLK